MRAAVVVVAAALRLSGRTGHFGLQWDGVTRTNLPSLKVGRFEGEADVVSEGLAQDLWKGGSVEVAAYQFKVHFFVAAEANAAGPVEAVGVTATTDSPDLTAEAELTGTLPGAAEIWVTLTCGSAVVAKTSVTLEMAPPFLSPTWVFSKVCRADDHTGLQVGTEPGTADVVAAGVPVWSTTHVVPYATFALPLFLSLTKDPAVLLDPVRVAVSPVGGGEAVIALRQNETARRKTGRWGSQLPLQTHAVAALLDQVGGVQAALHGAAAVSGRLRALGARAPGLVSLSGGLSDGGLLESNGSAPAMIATFACPHQGSFAVELTLEPFPAYQPFHPVPLAFVKVCGGAERAGFHVGTSPGGTELVKDGVLSGEHASLDNVAESSTVYVTYEPLSPADVDQAPELTVACAGLEGEKVVELTAKPAPDHVVLDYECLLPGLAFCELTFQFKMWKAPGPIKWTKECGGVRKDIVITSKLEEYPTAWAKGALDPGWSVRLPWDEDSVILEASAEVPVKAKLRVESDLAAAVAPSGVELGPEPTPLVVQANCSSAAEGAYAAELVVEMPGYKEIRVPFEKACKRPSFVTFGETPGGVMGLVITIALLVAIPVSICAFCVVRSLRGT